MVITELDGADSPQIEKKQKTLLFNTGKKRAANLGAAPLSSRKSKFLVQADEGERLDCLFKLNLNEIVVEQAFEGDEDAYSVQVCRGPLMSQVEEIFVPTDSEYFEDGPVNIPVDLEFTIKTIMNRAGNQAEFSSKIVAIKLY